MVTRSLSYATCCRCRLILLGEETIGLLAEAARVAGVSALLVIDALNDTRPRSMWRDNLEPLIATVGRYPNVRLLLTARTHYVGQILPPGLRNALFESSEEGQD